MAEDKFLHMEMMIFTLFWVEGILSQQQQQQHLPLNITRPTKPRASTSNHWFTSDDKEERSDLQQFLETKNILV